MKISCMVFIEKAQDYELRTKLAIQNFDKINFKNKKLFIVTEKIKNFKYINNSNVKHIFYNENIFYYKYLAKSIYLKSICYSCYLKLKRFMIIYLSIILIKKENYDYLFYFNNFLKLIKNISNEFLDKFKLEKYLIGYLDRSYINFYDDTDFRIFNLKNKEFHNFENYLLDFFSQGKFSKHFDYSIEYFSTVTRFAIQNLYNIQNINLMQRINSNKVNLLPINLYQASNLSEIFLKENNFLKIQSKIHLNKVMSLKNKKVNVYNLFKNIELSGFFNENDKILHIYENNDAYLNVNYPYSNFEQINLSDFLKQKFKEKIYDLVFFDTNLLFKHNYINIIINSKIITKNILLRLKYYLNKKQDNITNSDEKIKNISKNFVKVQYFKNLKSDIINLKYE